MPTRTGLWIAMIGALLVAASCASSPAPEPKTASDEPADSSIDATKTVVQAEVQPSVSGYQGEENACDGRECSPVGAECCAGYSCGFDPSRSRVQRYCLPE